MRTFVGVSMGGAILSQEAEPTKKLINSYIKGFIVIFSMLGTRLLLLVKLFKRLFYYKIEWYFHSSENWSNIFTV